MKKLNIKSVNELDPSKVYKIKVGETLCELKRKLSYAEYWTLDFDSFHDSLINKLIESGCEVYEEEPEPTVVVEFETSGITYRVLSDSRVERREGAAWAPFLLMGYSKAIISAFLKKMAEIEARGEQP